MDTKKVASTINCKDGSVRSLALNTKSVLENNDLGGTDPSKAAWDFAKAVKTEFGDSFTQENARDHFTATFSSTKKSMSHKSNSTEKPAANTDNTSKRGTIEFGRKANSILKNDDVSKNEKIRQLLGLDHGISQIASAMELSYQRVKNVKKAFEKKKNV